MFFRFESPWIFLFLLILPILILRPWWSKLIFLAKNWSKPASLQYSFTPPARSFSWRLSLQSLLPTLRMLMLAFIITALARPQLGHTREIIHGQGVDITLALDISGSMASLDFQPLNRLEAAKQVITEFINQRPYDRIGLVVFASNAFHQCPPTVDHQALNNILSQVRLATDLGIQDRTAMGMGLANAANMLKDSTVKSKVIILLTDGVNNTGEIDPLTAAQAAQALGIKVYTIGMGKLGQVPYPMVDAFGRKTITYHQSEIDEDTLKSIAAKTGGLYFRAEDMNGLQQIYEDINKLEKSQIEIQRFMRYQELAQWFLIPAIFLMITEMILRKTVLRSIP